MASGGRALLKPNLEAGVLSVVLLWLCGGSQRVKVPVGMA